MRNSGRLLVASMLGFVVTSACSSFSATDSAVPPDDEGGAADPPSVPDDAADASARPDSPSTDAMSAADAPNLLQNGDFHFACAAWAQSPNATLTPEDGGCQVCVDAAVAFNFGQMVSGPLPEGSTLQMSSSVEKPPMAPSVAAVGPVLRTMSADGGILAASSNGAVALGNGPTPVDALLGVGKDVAGFSLNFGSSAPAGGGCFVVEDVVVTLTP